MNSSNPSHQSMDFVMKLGIWCISSINFNFLNLSQNAYDATEKISWDEIKRMDSENWYRFSYVLSINLLACQLCAIDDKTDSNSKWVKKLTIWLCCPNDLVYFWRYQSVMLCRHMICLMIQVNVSHLNSRNYNN